MLVCPIQEEAASTWIVKTPFLSSHESMAIYHRLYWNRLCNFFYTTYPFLTRLFGFQEMREKLVMPYLLRHPPNHWCLDYLSHSLLQWIEEEYPLKDKFFILEAAKLDKAHRTLFLAIEEPMPTGSASEELFLQPYVELFAFGCDLVRFREHCLTKSVEYWEKNSFPSLVYDKPYYFVIYRSQEGIVYEEICATQFQLLSAFKKGSSLSIAIERLNGEKSLEKDLPVWLYHWATLRLLSTQNGVVK